MCSSRKKAIICFVILIILAIIGIKLDYDKKSSKNTDKTMEIKVEEKFSITEEDLAEDELKMDENNQEDNKEQQSCDKIPDPREIKYFMGIGDSVTRGFLADDYYNPQNTKRSLMEYIGISFITGGDDGIMSLPRLCHGGEIKSDTQGLTHGIQKMYSYGEYTEHTTTENHLNVAITGASIQSIDKQINELIRRWDKLVEKNSTDWKLITLFIGSNDLCGVMNRYRQMTEKEIGTIYNDYVRESLGKIYKKWPINTIVCLLTPPNLSKMHKLIMDPAHENESKKSAFFRISICPGLYQQNGIKKIIELRRELIKALKQITHDWSEKHYRNSGFIVRYIPDIFEVSKPLADSVSPCDYYHPSRQGHEYLAKIVYEYGLINPVEPL